MEMQNIVFAERDAVEQDREDKKSADAVRLEPRLVPKKAPVAIKSIIRRICETEHRHVLADIDESIRKPMYGYFHTSWFAIGRGESRVEQRDVHIG